MQAQTLRHIANGNQYNKYFGKAKHEDPLLIKGEVFDTLDLMQKIIKETINQTKPISRVLKGRNLKETASNIWNFVYRHIQYKPDTPGIEELRTPNRTWADRKTGVDCDCYSIFISSILNNLNIPHSLRIAEYDNKGYYQHVYVIIPNGKSHITIDPVLDNFNEEKSYTKKYDKIMIQHQLLNGVSSTTEVVPFGAEFDALEGLGSVDENDFLNATKKHLMSTFAMVTTNPNKYRDVVDPEVYAEQLAYAIENWDDPVAREAVLEELSEMEDLGEFDAVDTENPSVDGLGRYRFFRPSRSFRHRIRTRRGYEHKVAKSLPQAKVQALRARRKINKRVIPATIRRGVIQKNAELKPIQAQLMPGKKITLEISLGRRKRGGFWKKVRNAVNTVKTKVKNTATKVKTTAANVKTRVKTAVNKAKQVVKNAGGKILRHNPLSFAIRKGLILAFKTNLFHFAEKLKWAYLSETQARVKGFDLYEWRKLKNILSKINGIYIKLGGNPNDLKKSILTGRAGGLGLVATATAGGAASGVLVKIASFFKKVNLKKLFGRVKGISAKVKGRLTKNVDISKMDRSELAKVRIPTERGVEDIAVDEGAMLDNAEFNDNTLYADASSRSKEGSGDDNSKKKNNTGLIVVGGVGVATLIALAMKGGSKKTLKGVEV